jgi:hypothetical protein
MDRMTVLVVLAVSSIASAAPALDSAQIEQLTGAKGKLDEKEGVFKVSVPRSDLKVTAAGVHLTPPMGLTTWAAFTRAGAHTMVMGDLCLTEDQVNPVMSVALDNGLEVTALHNHFFWDTPKIMFMHIGGMGDEGELAGAVGKVFATIQSTSGGKGRRRRRRSIRPSRRWIPRNWMPRSLTPTAASSSTKLTCRLAGHDGKRMPIDPDTGVTVEPSPVPAGFILQVLVPWIAAGAKDN